MKEEYKEEEKVNNYVKHENENKHKEEKKRRKRSQKQRRGSISLCCVAEVQDTDRGT